MRFALNMAMVLLAGLTACRERDKPIQNRDPFEEPSAVRPLEPGRMEPQARTTTRETRSGAQDLQRPEVPVSRTLIPISKVKWIETETGLPEGAKVSIVEGAPPFPANQTFTVLAQLPKNYTIPPHTHLVSERVTVLKGALSFGHGEKLDRAAATKIQAGGLVLIPAGHVHYAFTTDQDTVIALSGVGPWGIVYVNPKDDPRSTPATKPTETFASQWDAPVDNKIVQAGDVQFTEPPAGVMPPGVKMAVLEGAIDQPKTFILRLQMQKGQVFPVHSHSHSERFIVLSGKADFAFGETFDEKKLQHLETPTIGIAPAGEMHFGRALEDNTVVQIMGVGPFDMKLAADGGMPPTPTERRPGGTPLKPIPQSPSPGSAPTR
jgi:quercetin dioxygenase-like cupin family protein